MFNPRRDIWAENFFIDRETGEIKGLTDVGRVTLRRLRMNGETQLAARTSWLKLELFE